MKDTKSNLQEKELSALQCLQFVKNHTRIGLGTGSTTAIAIKLLGEKIKNENLSIQCCVTSYQSMLIAKENNIPVYPISYFSELDISIDGADEVDPEFNLIKGGGGAHTKEKIVHSMSKQFICIVDSSKHVKQLGEKFPIPIEVIPESVFSVLKKLESLHPHSINIRMAEKKDGPVITDNGNLIIDLYLQKFSPEELEIQLNSIPGIVENGIFSIYKPHVVITGNNIQTR